jgi:hypothetical protein
VRPISHPPRRVRPWKKTQIVSTVIERIALFPSPIRADARLKQRVDLLEAALRVDLEETTRVIYDAVWSDPSEPSKTYHNAAQAVLAKLHRRAGISAMLESHRPLAS